MACAAPHPEHEQVTCLATSGHDLHYAFLDAARQEPVEWPNEDWRPPVTGRGTSPGAAAERLRDLAGQVPDSTGTRTLPGTQAGPLTPGQHRERIDGMLTSYAALKEHPTQWAIVLDCIRQACLHHPEVSTNDVWDALLMRSDFYYDGEAGGRGWMGSMLSNWARKEGLVGPKVGTEPNRQPWAHSGLPVKVYPSLVYRREV